MQLQPENPYRPRPAPLFHPRKIVLAQGSVTTASRRRFADSIVSVYPDATVIEQPDVPHNRVQITDEPDDELGLHYRGHRVLVLGEHQSAVRRSDEENNNCPNFWHFSPYGYCPYGCSYCYLAGTQGVRYSPSIKVFVNLDEILDKIDKIARKLGYEEAFYLGKLQDGMALDPLTGYSRKMIPFFAEHPYARLRVLSKCANFDNVLDLDHREHTVLCWSLNPPDVRKDYELITPPIEDRIAAMKKCAEAGYPIRVMLMPIIPIADWQRHYDEFIECLLNQVPLQRLTLGGICSYSTAKRMTHAKLKEGNLISRSLTVINNAPDDGRARYSRELRANIYSHLLGTIRRLRPKLTCALCMEDPSLARDLGLGYSNIGRCNCIL